LFLSSALLSFGAFLARETLFAKNFPSVQTSVVHREGVQILNPRPPPSFNPRLLKNTSDEAGFAVLIGLAIDRKLLLINFPGRSESDPI
jgi:hypothetical protein